MRTQTFAFSVLLASLISGAYAGPPDLARSFQPYIDADQNVGIVVTTLRNGEATTATFGSALLGGGAKPGLDTVFQIGSASKTFTSLVLAELVLEKRITLDDPISKFFPEISELQRGPVGRITLRQLSTHTSGLPRLPENMALANILDPYADYTPALLIAALKNPALLTRVGPYPIRYSNMGAGLLGYILTRVTGLPYDAMIRERVTKPLGMKDSGVSLSRAETRRSAQGYDEAYNAVPFWHFYDTLVGAGGIHSTITDMTRYLRANLDPDRSPLGRAIAFSHQVEARGTPESVGVPATADIGLAWIRSTVGGDRIVWHNGEVGGFFSFTGINETRHTAIELIANTANGAVQDCLLELLIDRPCSAIAKDYPVSDADLAQRVGTYVLQADPTQTIEIRQPAHFLSATFDGQLSARLHAQAENQFSLTVDDKADTLAFTADPSGNVTQLVITQDGVANIAFRRR